MVELHFSSLPSPARASRKCASLPIMFDHIVKKGFNANPLFFSIFLIVFYKSFIYNQLEEHHYVLPGFSAERFPS
ncbi:hypothetical protein U14_05168 [Candidatus Moduliflexus flocculans]|uniref:Uncharacterized protein n=1 Tax=Candidatus Moduliflexus flocculans TaxID=1499966 RepID=A0A081BR62_9BACT|nr:hypothetical protein U14_05168 [Candidatus Moduliflexus flocculans]